MGQNLGKVGICPMGDYASGKSYERLSSVLYNHEYWVAVKDVPVGAIPAEGSVYWQKMASRGEQGPQGQSYVDKEMVPIVDNLTTGGSSNVLSAEQGKVLKAELTELESDIVNQANGAAYKYEDWGIDLPNIGQITPIYGSVGSSSSAYHSDFIPTPTDVKFLIVTSEINQYCAGVSFYSRMEYTKDALVKQEMLASISIVTTARIAIPSDAEYMVFCSYNKTVFGVKKSKPIEAMPLEDGVKQDELNALVDKLPFVRTEQLLDKDNIEILSIGYKSSTMQFVADANCRMVSLPINVIIGGAYTMKIISEQTENEIDIADWGILLSNVHPTIDGTILQLSNRFPSSLSASLTSSVNASFINIYIKTSQAKADDFYKSLFDKIVLVNSLTTPTEYIPYKEFLISKDNLSFPLNAQSLGAVPQYQGSTNVGKMLVVGSDGIVALGDRVAEDTSLSDVVVEGEKTLYLGASVLVDGMISLENGWSGNLKNGFSHIKGNASDLVISTQSLDSKAYLLRYKSDKQGEAIDANSALRIDIEDVSDIDPYNGTYNIEIGFVALGSGVIKLKAGSNYECNISDLEICPIVTEQDAVSSIVFVANNIDGASMKKNITGFWNVALGAADALANNESGSRNIAVGHSSLLNLKSGTRNIGVGTFSMMRLKKGERNIAIGADAMYYQEEAEDNIVIGKAAMGNQVGTKTNERNVAIGTQALLGNNDNTQDNVAIGTRALASYPSSKNVALGTKAGYWSRGTSNVFVGNEAQSTVYVTGNDNTIIGAEAKAYKGGGTADNPVVINNAIAIGKGAQVSQSNEIRIGNISNTLNYVIFGNKKIIFNADGSCSWESI